MNVERAKLERGMMLLLEDAPREGDERPIRYQLWTVASVRHGAKSASAKLINWSPGCRAEATATFPDGLVAEPWQVFALNQRDLALVWKAGTSGE